MENKKIIAPVLLLLVSQPVMAVDVKLNMATGLDTNPFTLSDEFSPDSAFFVDAKVIAKHRAENGLGVKASWQERVYEGGESDADNRTVSLAGDIKRNTEIGNTKISYWARIKYSDYDKTYVSHLTGKVGESGGESLADRYDWNAWDTNAGISFEVNNEIDLDLSVDFRDRDYEDYQALGQSNLDYDHWSLKGRVTYSPDKENRLRASYRYREREYNNRLGKDLTGNDVAGSNLEYEYHLVNISWRHKFDKLQSMTLSAAYEMRDDNVSGYYDQTNKKVQISYANKLSKTHRVNAKLAYKDYSYDNNEVLASLEGSEPINSKKGYALEVDYAYRLSDEEKNPWWLVASVSYEDYDSVNENYVYDRALFSMGIQKAF